METIHAIFENGVFRPVAPVTLPDRTEVEFEPRVIEDSKQSNGDAKEPTTPSDPLSAVYAIMGERYASGFSDTAARHNEHQP